MLGKIEGRKRIVQKRMWWLDIITDSMDVSLVSSRRWWWTWNPGVLQSQRVRHNWGTELNWNLKFKLNFTLNNLISKLKLTNHKLTSLRFGKSIQFIYGSLYFNISFFHFLFFNFYFYFILLYNTVLVLPYIDMNQARVYMSSQSWIPPRIKKKDFKFI